MTCLPFRVRESPRIPSLWKRRKGHPLGWQRVSEGIAAANREERLPARSADANPPTSGSPPVAPPHPLIPVGPHRAQSPMNRCSPVVKRKAALQKGIRVTPPREGFSSPCCSLVGDLRRLRRALRRSGSPARACARAPRTRRGTGSAGSKQPRLPSDPSSKGAGRTTTGPAQVNKATSGDRSVAVLVKQDTDTQLTPDRVEDTPTPFQLDGRNAVRDLLVLRGIPCPFLADSRVVDGWKILSYDDLIERSLWHVMHALAIPPVLDISVGFRHLDDDRLFWSSKSNHE